MNKMRYLIRKAGALLMMLCIVLTMAGCQTTTLDGGTGKNRSVVSEEMETAQAEENSVTKQLSEVSAVISSVAGDEDMMMWTVSATAQRRICQNTMKRRQQRP